MTRKDFIEIADMLIQTKLVDVDMTESEIMKIVLSFAHQLMRKYPKFNETIFIQYIKDRI